MLGSELLMVGVFGKKGKEQEVRCVEVKIENADRQMQTVTDLDVPIICTSELPKAWNDVIQKMKVRKLIPAEQIGCGGPSTIELMIGADYYWAFATGEADRIDEHLVCVKTTLGWTIQGPTPASARITQCSRTTVLKVSVDYETSMFLQRLREFESVGCSDSCNERTEDWILKTFSESVARDGKRYSVAPPWKDEVYLADNKAVL